MVDRDLLMPSLGGVQVERAPYSSKTGFLAAFFGGPLAACGYGVLNARRLGRLTSDGPWLAAFVVADIALMWLLTHGLVGLPWIDAVQQELGGSFGRIASRLFALIVFGWVCLAHRREQRAAELMGLERPNGFAPGLGLILMGLAAGAGIAEVIE